MKASSMSLVSQQCLLITVQQITVKIIDYTGSYIYIKRFIFNCLEKVIRISYQTVSLWAFVMWMPQINHVLWQGDIFCIKLQLFFLSVQLGSFQPSDQSQPLQPHLQALSKPPWWFGCTMAWVGTLSCIVWVLNPSEPCRSLLSTQSCVITF